MSSAQDRTDEWPTAETLDRVEQVAREADEVAEAAEGNARELREIAAKRREQAEIIRAIHEARGLPEAER